MEWLVGLTLVFGELLENFADDLADALQGFQIVFGFVELLGELLEAIAHWQK